MQEEDDDPVGKAQERAGARPSQIDPDVGRANHVQSPQPGEGDSPAPIRPEGLTRATGHWPAQAGLAYQGPAALAWVKERSHERRIAAQARTTGSEIDRSPVEADNAHRNKPDTDRLASLAEENAKLLVQQSRQMHDIRARLDPLGLDASGEAAQAARIAPQTDAVNDASLTDVGDRFAAALDDHYQSHDPYRSLGRAAMAEYSAFCSEQDALARELANEPDPLVRERLELRASIEAADYVESSSRRIAANDHTITGAEETEQGKEHQVRAEESAALSADLREAYADAHRERAAWLAAEDEVTTSRSADNVHTQDRGGREGAEAEQIVGGSRGSDGVEFHEAGAEITDTKAARLSGLAHRHAAIEGRAAAREQQPDRTNDGGNGM